MGQYQTDVVLLNAGALLIMAPTMLLFIFLQRYFIRAMLAGSVKGDSYVNSYVGRIGRIRGIPGAGRLVA